VSEQQGDPRPLPPVSLVVVDRKGIARPGFMLRAGDFITETHYDHGRRQMTATVGERPLTLRLQLRRWWEGRRR
jgi:hypothetical protein